MSLRPIPEATEYQLVSVYNFEEAAYAIFAVWARNDNELVKDLAQDEAAGFSVWKYRGLECEPELHICVDAAIIQARNTLEQRGPMAHECTVISAEGISFGVVEGDSIRLTARPA